MEKLRNGRVILENRVQNIVLPPRATYNFAYSIYVRPQIGNAIVCLDKDTECWDANYPFCERENTFLLGQLVGKDNYQRSVTEPHEYRLVTSQFDVLQDANVVYAHESIDDICSQLGISSPAVFLDPQYFSMRSTGEKVDMEIAESPFDPYSGRSATFDSPVWINGELYLLEVKGVNAGSNRIIPDRKGNKSGDPSGALHAHKLTNIVKNLSSLNSRGYTDKLLVSAYELPGVRSYTGGKLAAYIRAIKASPTLAHYTGNLFDVARSLDQSPEDLATMIIENAAGSLANLWNLNMSFGEPLHEQNIRLQGITDFCNIKPAGEATLANVCYDAASCVFSCQNVMQSLLGADIRWPSEEERSDFQRSERDMDLAQEKQAALFLEARAIIAKQVNQRLGLNIPPNFGTMLLGANVYNEWRNRGLKNRHDRTFAQRHIEKILSTNPHFTRVDLNSPWLMRVPGRDNHGRKLVSWEPSVLTERVAFEELLDRRDKNYNSCT